MPQWPIVEGLGEPVQEMVMEDVSVKQKQDWLRQPHGKPAPHTIAVMQLSRR